MHLIMIRHGQSYVNLPDWKGEEDASLTPLGQQQAEALAGWLARQVRPVAIYTSAMRRALETTERVATALALPFTPDDRLREIGNAWPDATPIDFTRDRLEWAGHWASERPFTPVYQGGETWGDFITRVGRSLYEIADRHDGHADIVLVICHGGVINAAVDIAFNIGPWRSTDLWLRNTSLTHLEYKPPEMRQEMWRLHGINLCYHLIQPDGAMLGYEAWHWPTP